MNFAKLCAGLFGAVAAAPLALWSTTPANAQANEQFLPALVYRTGAYAPNGIPFANGFVDYFNLINERDGGLNGVKLVVEECETGYATDRGVECYERLKGKGPTGAAAITPLSTGITFALTEKAPVDKIPIITMGYGRSESADGSVFAWNFPILGTYWSAADMLIQHIGKLNGGLDKLKGKKIALVYHDSPYGREPIPLLQKRAELHGYQLLTIPVTHPGVEQKAAWLQIRQQRPNYVFLWGWGVMNSTAIKEAAAVNYPRSQMYGVWWSGAEPDVTPAGDGAKGYNALALHPAGAVYKVHQDLFRHLYDKGKGLAKREEVGEVLYNRGMINAMLTVEAIRTAQKRYGNKPMTGEQTRWGLENLKLDTARVKEIGFEGLVNPLNLSCNDHEGVQQARIFQWDGKQWVFQTEWLQADMKVVRPMYADAAKKYAAEKKITPRDCNKES